MSGYWNPNPNKYSYWTNSSSIVDSHGIPYYPVYPTNNPNPPVVVEPSLSTVVPVVKPRLSRPEYRIAREQFENMWAKMDIRRLFVFRDSFFRYVNTLLNYFDSQDFAKYPEWPHQIQRYMVMPHKDHLARINCYSFFVGNGMIHSLAVRMITFNGRPGYDNEAMSDFFKMSQTFRQSFDRNVSRSYYWDMHTGITHHVGEGLEVTPNTNPVDKYSSRWRKRTREDSWRDDGGMGR